MSVEVNWVELAYRLETVSDNGNGYGLLGGGDIAKQALIALVGEGLILSAVDAVLLHDRGSEIARSVLRLLSPEIARQKCMEIIRTSLSTQDVWEAGYLLSDLGAKNSLPLYDELSRHENLGIRSLSMRLLENIYFGGWLEVEETIKLLEPHLANADDKIVDQAQQMIAHMQEDLEVEKARLAELDRLDGEP